MELTREIVLAEPPGKRLDSWIAEKVMGWRKKTFPGGGGGFTAWVDENEKVMKLISNSTMSETCYRCDYFRPSTDTAAVWEVEEEIDKRNLRVAYCQALQIVIRSQKDYVTTFDYVHATPEQRCKAALLAVMEE
jgi:hypothetical protein